VHTCSARGDDDVASEIDVVAGVLCANCRGRGQGGGRAGQCTLWRLLARSGHHLPSRCSVFGLVTGGDGHAGESAKGM
jgi:hypothetical protein